MIAAVVFSAGRFDEEADLVDLMQSIRAKEGCTEESQMPILYLGASDRTSRKSSGANRNTSFDQ